MVKKNYRGTPIGEGSKKAVAVLTCLLLVIFVILFFCMEKRKTTSQRNSGGETTQGILQTSESPEQPSMDKTEQTGQSPGDDSGQSSESTGSKIDYSSSVMFEEMHYIQELIGEDNYDIMKEQIREMCAGRYNGTIYLADYEEVSDDFLYVTFYLFTATGIVFQGDYDVVENSLVIQQSTMSKEELFQKRDSTQTTIK